jgi:transcriptional regulator with XRE-family HTH domain
MGGKLGAGALYKQVRALVNHEIRASEFLRDVYLEDMTESVYARWIGGITKLSSEQDIVEAAAGAYDDLHKMNLFLEMMRLDEFDNFLVFVVAGRFVKDLSHIPAMAGKNEYDFSEQISDFVWESCRKSDAHMLQLEGEVAASMARALRLRFYGHSEEKVEEIAKFIEEYYQVENNSQEQNKDGATGGSLFRTMLGQIKEKRKAELTLNEMSRRCGIPIALMNAYLTGEAYPIRDNVFKLAYGLKLTQLQLSEMFEALDKDLKGASWFKSFQIDKNDPRDMFLYNTLTKRVTIEEINRLLAQNQWGALDQKPFRKKSIL